MQYKTIFRIHVHTCVYIYISYLQLHTYMYVYIYIYICHSDPQSLWYAAKVNLNTNTSVVMTNGISICYCNLIYGSITKHAWKVIKTHHYPSNLCKS